MSRRRLVSLLFVCTGASGLVFEVLWVKQLTLVVSSTTFAVSLTVSVFLGGLMLGSELSGRIARRTSRPLRAYAIAELLAGALASGVTLLLPHLPEHAAGGVLATLVLLPPTVAMGATLPLLSRYVAAEDARVGADIGGLYTLNTLGAVLGCGLGGFVAVSLWGVTQTSLIASAVNFGVGLAALAISRLEKETKASNTAAASSSGWVDVLFFLSGFASIAYEVLWFRVLSTFFDATTYAFTVLLCTFLLGLVLGGALYVRRWSAHPRPLELLTGLLSGIALSTLIAFMLIGLSPGLAHAAHELAVSGAWGFIVAMALHALVIILPPTVLIGAVFPLVIRIGTERAADAGPRVGRLYAVNTLGGILGSFLAGFVLIPTLGTQLSYSLICLLSMGLALYVQRKDDLSPRKARLQLAAVAGIVALGLWMPPRDYWTHAQVATPDAKILSLREGRDGTLSVLEYTKQSVIDSKMYRCDASAPDFAHRKLTFGAISYASSVLPARRYMRFEGHIGMLLRPKAADVLQVCFGTGTTAGAFVSHPQLKSLTIVDLNPDVFAAAPLFNEVNHDALSDARVHRVVDDGRHFLLSTAQLFDVVSFEPPPPRAAGVVNLYSRDFYALVKQHLNPAGVVVQWVPLDQQSSRLDRALVKAMSDVFKHVSIYVPARLHGVVVASDEPLEEDLASWDAQYASPAVRASLIDVGFENAEQLHATRFAHAAAVERYLGDVRPVTDDRPSIEHFLFEWDKPFDIAELIAVRDAEPGAAWEGERLRSLAAQAARNRDYDEARTLSLQADAQLPDNPYGKFLRDIEYGCLVPR